MSKKLTYDSAYTELNKLLNELQSEEIGLDDLSKKLKRAIELSEFCKSQLRSIEEDIEKINDSMGQ
ncbi:MAG: exodeoxyribonuclease VII small subunit [Chitinophagales bacterium]|nr:exodeoxyribonuclease VII small subunit [Chitinophagales bacterium]